MFVREHAYCCAERVAILKYFHLNICERRQAMIMCLPAMQHCQDFEARMHTLDVDAVLCWCSAFDRLCKSLWATAT